MGTDGRGDLPQWRGASDSPASPNQGVGAGGTLEAGAGQPEQNRAKARAIAVAVIGLLVVGAVAVFALRPTQGEGDGAPSSAADTETLDDSQDGEPSDEPSNENSGGGSSSDEAPADDGSSAGEPTDGETAVRVAENPGEPSEYGHWIGRNLMTSSLVELTWSAIEGDEVVFRVHRFDRVPGLDPDTASFSDGVLVYEGTETSAVDDDVEGDRFYTYVLDADVGDETLPRRWTEALTIDDTEPPSPVTGLEASVSEEGVMLSWDPSSDNVEFAAYSVSIVEDGKLRYIGGGADVEQTTFLDNQVEAGQVTYAVMAVDFHDNRTEAVNITVMVP